MHPQRRPCPCRSTRRGLTLLETVLASVILSLAAASVVVAVGGITSGQERQLRKLEAAELANRLMIIFMDDEHELRAMPRVVEYGSRRYRWDVSEADVMLDPAKTGDDSRRAFGVERFRGVAINVWLSEESGGEAVPTDVTPSARLVRMVDIVNKNPDSMSFMLGDETRRTEFINRVIQRRGGGGGGGGSAGGGGGGRGGTAGPGSGGPKGPPMGPTPQPPKRGRGGKP